MCYAAHNGSLSFVGVDEHAASNLYSAGVHAQTVVGRNTTSVKCIPDESIAADVFQPQMGQIENSPP
eukprot:scaffold173621_cov28-Attheya_sp.AAC.1